MSDILKNRVIFIASDHAGYSLKELFKAKRPDINWKDLGCYSEERVDYPDFANLVADQVSQSKNAIGVLICGSGQGMSMRANKFPHIRAALCWNEESASLARKHNDANVLCVGARLLKTDLALKILDIFLNEKFENGRHLERVNKISNPC